jgi:hypothetical protein
MFKTSCNARDCTSRRYFYEMRVLFRNAKATEKFELVVMWKHEYGINDGKSSKMDGGMPAQYPTRSAKSHKFCEVSIELEGRA